MGFRAEMIALADSETGLVGRATWTDQNGSQVFSDFHGEGATAGKRILGTFVGGTGRYADATGSYEFAWEYVLQDEDGSIQGRSVGLKGRIKVVPAPGAPSQGKTP